jgi:hypothetical protein
MPAVQPRTFHTVGDAMTRGALICATVDTTVDEGQYHQLCAAAPKGRPSSQ